MGGSVALPLINGVHFDYSSVRVSFDGGEPEIHVLEISYKDALEPGEVRGTSARVTGRTRGQYKPEASFTMTKAAWAEFCIGLGIGYMEKVFEIFVNYAELGLPVVPDIISGCRIKNVDESHSDGNADALKVKVDLHVMHIVRAGNVPLLEIGL